MPQYQITSPDGRKFKVTAPEGATQEQVLSYAQSNYSGGEEAPKQKDQNDMGPLAAFVQNTPAVPFAQRIQAGGAAAVNYPIAKLTGSDVSLKDLYETAREKQIATDEANPDAALAGGITGAVASLPIAMAGLPGKVNSATKLGKAADISNKVAVATDKFVRGAATTGGKIGRAAGVGAGTAGVYGYGASKNDLDTGAAFQDAAASAAIGAPLAAIPGATSAAKSGISRVASDLRPKSVLTTQQLKDAAAPLYDKFTQSGGIYSSRLTDEMADLAENSKLTGIAGKQKASDKALNDVLDFYSSLRGSKLSPQELQRLDQSLAEDISRFNRAGDTNFGRILNDLKYELRAKAYDPKNAVRYIEGGDPSAVQDLLQANKLWSQSYKTRDIEKIVERAGRSENQQTSIRTGLNSLLSNDKKMAQYSPQERKILEDAQKRGAVGGIIKAFGNRLTDTLAGGLTGFTMGGTAGALAGAAAGRAAGGALTNAAGGMQAGRLQNALSKIQTGSPVASQAANVGAALPAAIGLATGVGTAAGRGQQSDAQQPQPPMQPVMPQPTQTVVEPLSYNTTQQPNILDKISQAESGGNTNAKNPNSSASGEFQFVDKTWNAMVNKYGKQYGITKADKANPHAQRTMASLLMKENENQFLNSGIQPNDADLYMAHFLGGPAAVKAKKNLGKGVIAARMFPSAAGPNQSIFFEGKRPRTLDEVYQIMARKVGA